MQLPAECGKVDSRQVVGWSMQLRMETDLALNALLTAVWRRQPQSAVTIHCDQGSQFSSHEWQSFLKAHHLVASMSRRGNCYDNAVAESFFQLLKRERIRRKIYEAGAIQSAKSGSSRLEQASDREPEAAPLPGRVSSRRKSRLQNHFRRYFQERPLLPVFA